MHTESLRIGFTMHFVVSARSKFKILDRLPRLISLRKKSPEKVSSNSLHSYVTFSSGANLLSFRILQWTVVGGSFTDYDLSIMILKSKRTLALIDFFNCRSKRSTDCFFGFVWIVSRGCFLASSCPSLSAGTCRHQWNTIILWIRIRYRCPRHLLCSCLRTLLTRRNSGAECDKEGNYAWVSAAAVCGTLVEPRGS